MKSVGNTERDSNTWEAVVKNDQSLILESVICCAHLPEMNGKDTQMLILVSNRPPSPAPPLPGPPPPHQEAAGVHSQFRPKMEPSSLGFKNQLCLPPKLAVTVGSANQSHMFKEKF